MALDKTPDLEGLSPSQRAAIYKERAAAAGMRVKAATAPLDVAAPTSAPVAETGPAPSATAPEARPAAPAAAPVAAAKPAPPPEPPKPKDPPFLTAIQERVPNSAWEWRHGYAEIKVPREHLLDAAWMLRDAGFDYLSFVTEVDWHEQGRFEMLYHLFSYDYRAQPVGVVLRADLPREDQPEIASLTAVWPGAELMEREAHEMLGVRFLGHPDLTRLLLPDDFRGFPMRKDFETDFEYITVKHLVRELETGFRGR